MVILIKNNLLKLFKNNSERSAMEVCFHEVHEVTPENFSF